MGGWKTAQADGLIVPAKMVSQIMHEPTRTRMSREAFGKVGEMNARDRGNSGQQHRLSQPGEMSCDKTKQAD